MKNIKLYFLLTVFIALILSNISATPVLASAKNDKSVFSFYFENCTVSDALMEISDKSGINIITNRIIEKQILSKSYKNKSLGKILTDLLRGENCAVVWNYNNGNLGSIDLWTFDKKGSVGSVAYKMRKTSSRNDRAFPSDLDAEKINKIKDLYSKNKQAISSNSPNIYSSNSNASGRNNSPVRINRSRIPNSSSVSASRHQNISSNSGQEREDINIQPSPSLPPTEKQSTGLEPPPMPPGL